MKWIRDTKSNGRKPRTDMVAVEGTKFAYRRVLHPDSKYRTGEDKYRYTLYQVETRESYVIGGPSITEYYPAWHWGKNYSGRPQKQMWVFDTKEEAIRYAGYFQEDENEKQAKEAAEEVEA